MSNLVTKLSIDDSGIEQSMAALGRQMKLVQSEFQAASSKLGEHGSAQDALKTKADTLNKQMDIQAQRIAKLKKQHEEAAAAKGKDAKETQKLETELNRAVNQYNKMHNELQSTTAELEKQTSAWHKIASEVDKAAKKMDDIGRKMTAAGTSLSLMVTAPLAAVGGASTKASIDMESAMAGVRKTVDMTTEEFVILEQEIRDMSKQMPAAATEIAGVAEAAGQLGVKNEAIMGFTKTMTDLGIATNMSANDAATSLARLANITQMPQKDFDRLGSTITALGNNLATTESEITAMGLRLAGAGNQIKMTEAEILAFAGSLSSVGIEAEAGGSAFSRVMIEMAMAAEVGGDNLNNFAAVAGMSAEQFKKTFNNDAASALVAFTEGLGRMSAAGENTFGVLDKLGLSEIRVRDTLLRASGAGDLFRNSLELGTKAWEENTALTNEANTRYETTASQLQILGNRITDAAITLGDALVPAIMAALDALEPFFTSIEEGAAWFANLDAENQKTILTLAALAAAAGPLLIIAGQLVVSIGNLIPVIKGVGTAFMWLTTTPWGLVISSAAIVVGAFFAIKNAMDSNRESAEKLAAAQQELQNIQKNGIDESEIATTQEKINKLNELTTKYEELIDLAARSNDANNGRTNRAMREASDELGTSFKELKKEAAALGVKLEYLDDKGRIAAVSSKQLADATNTLSKAVKNAKEESNAAVIEAAKSISVRRQEVANIESLLKTYRTAKKDSNDWTNAQKELIRLFPHLASGTNINTEAIQQLSDAKKTEIKLEWQSVQSKTAEALAATQNAIKQQEAAITIANGIDKISGSGGLAEVILNRMNGELARLRGEAAALEGILKNKDPNKIGGVSGGSAPAVFVPKAPKVKTPKAPKAPKAPKSPKAEAYENKALDEAYKQLEHKKRMDEMTLESELKTLEQIKAKHVKTADERMEIEERLYDVRKALGDRTLEKALDDLDKSKQLGKLTESEEINRLKRIKKQYADSAEERKQIDDMIFSAELRRQEALKKKIEEEKQLRKEATDYVSQQLQAAYEDRLVRDELTAEEQYKLQDRLLNDQIYLNNNYLKKVLADNRYTAEEKKKIEREVTETVRKQTNERLKLEREHKENLKKILEEESKARIDSINNLSKGVQDALKAKYQEEKRIAEESIKDAQQANEDWKKSQLDAIKTVHDARVDAAQRAADAEIAAIESTYNARIEAIQKELDALNEAEKQKSRDDLDAEDAKKITRLQGLIEYEHDDFNRAQLQKELNKVLADQAERHRQEQLQDQKDALKTEQEELKNKQKEEIDAVKEQLALKKEIMAAEYQAEQDKINAIYASQKASLDQQLLDTQNHYNQLLSAKSIQAEAEKMIIDKQQKEILELLDSYGDNYNQAGQTLGEQMVAGFKPHVDEISSMIANVVAQINAARSAAVSAMNEASRMPSGGGNQGSNSNNSSSSGSGPVQGKVVNVTQVFNTPVTSPSDVSRAGTRAAQQMAMGV
ncbi:MAG: phage tail tape measure protein [Bacillota bacterium]